MSPNLITYYERMYLIKGEGIGWDNLLAEINAQSTRSAPVLGLEEKHIVYLPCLSMMGQSFEDEEIT